MANTEKYPNKTKIKDDLGTLKDYYFNLRELEQQLGQYQMHVAVYNMIKGLSFRDERYDAYQYFNIMKMSRKVYISIRKKADRILLSILSVRRNIEFYQYDIKEEVEKLKEVKSMMKIFGYKERDEKQQKDEVD